MLSIVVHRRIVKRLLAVAVAVAVAVNDPVNVNGPVSVRKASESRANCRHVRALPFV